LSQRKVFDTVSINDLWNILEELEVPFEFNVTTIRLYENVIAKFRNTKGWLEEINCNIGVKQGCPVSSTLLGIYSDKLEPCLEKGLCWHYFN
jgi:hypothetical protein